MAREWRSSLRLANATASFAIGTASFAIPLGTMSLIATAAGL